MELAIPTAIPTLLLTRMEGKLTGSRGRLLHSGIVVVYEIHGIPVDIAEQPAAIGSSLASVYREAAYSISLEYARPKLPLEST